MLNVEIKARTSQLDNIRRILHENKAEYRGTDHQIDTYFNIPDGRLKLRQGDIENNLIYYKRPTQKGPKISDFALYPPGDSQMLKSLLNQALGEKVKVDKQREIYYINEIKIHLDEVRHLGTFVEIEVFDRYDTRDISQLQAKCQDLMNRFGIEEEDLIDRSYSDMILEIS